MRTESFERLQTLRARYGPKIDLHPPQLLITNRCKAADQFFVLSVACFDVSFGTLFTLKTHFGLYNRLMTLKS